MSACATLLHPAFNKYFRMQLIVDEATNQVWLFTREGIVGAAQPQSKVEKSTRKRVLGKFASLYQSKTGQAWSPGAESPPGSGNSGSK